MRRITAIAASAFYVFLLGLGGETELVFAEQRPTYKRMEPIAPPSPSIGEFGALSGDDAAMHSSVVDTLPQPPADHFLEMSPDNEESCTVECESCECCDEIGPECCETLTRGRWIVDLGASALQTDMAVSDLEAWPEDFGAAGRIVLGYEWPNGQGIRTQAWGYSMEGDVRSQSSLGYLFGSDFFAAYYVTPGAYNRFLFFPQSFAYARPIEITAASVYLDAFKTVYSRYGDFTVGMGPAFGHLEFNFPPAGDWASFNGGGISAFGQGYVSFFKRSRLDIGLTGQMRAALLTGNWDIAMLNEESGHSEAMSILELSAGPEIRYRIGRTDGRFLFLKTVAEFQQWRSDGMGPIAGDTLALQGASMNLGFLW